MAWLPAPPVGGLSVVTVFIGKRGNHQLPWNAPTGPIQPLALVTTESRVAWLVHTQHPVEESTSAMIEEYCGRIRNFDFAKSAPREPGVRAILWGAHGDGDRFFVELAWDDGS